MKAVTVSKKAVLTLTLTMGLCAGAHAQSLISKAFSEIKQSIAPTQVSVLETQYNTPASVQTFIENNKEILSARQIANNAPLWSAPVVEKDIQSVTVKKSKYEFYTYNYKRSGTDTKTVVDYMYDITVTLKNGSTVKSTKNMNDDRLSKTFGKVINLAGASKINMDRQANIYRESGYRYMTVTPRNKNIAQTTK